MVAKLHSPLKVNVNFVSCRMSNWGSKRWDGYLKRGSSRHPQFIYTMVDLFGPYVVRGEVQKRASGKAYGVIFTDLVSRAVHIEAVYGYDTCSFLLALSTFASIRADGLNTSIVIQVHN